MVERGIGKIDYRSSRSNEARYMEPMIDDVSAMP